MVQVRKLAEGGPGSDRRDRSRLNTVRPDRRGPGGRGQSLVELTLCLPFLLLLLFAVIDFGVIYYQLLELNNAVRSGARVGAQRESDTAIKTIVKEYAPFAGISDSAITITVRTKAGDVLGAGTRQAGSRLTVSLSYPLMGMTPLRSMMAASGLTQFTISSTCRVEQS